MLFSLLSIGDYMSEAINIVFYIFNKFINLLFNEIQILEGVYLGWVIIVVIIFGIIFNSLLNIPKLGIMDTSKERKTKDHE